MPATKIVPLPNIPYSQQEQGVDLPRGVWITKLIFRVSGAVDIANDGTTSGTVLAESVARLLRTVRISWDGVSIIDSLSGRDLVAVAKRGVSRTLDEATLASGANQADTPVRIAFPVYFARPWLVNPFNTALPPLKVQSELKLYVSWETNAANAASAAGTGALLTGNDRTVTWETEPVLEVFAEVSDVGSTPLALPFYQKFTAPPWSAATSDLSFDFPRSRAIDMMVLATDYGTAYQPQDAINRVTLESGSMLYIRDESLAMLRQLEYQRCPGVPLADTGKLGVLMANGGKIRDGGFNPGLYSGTRMVLDMAAPTSGSGRLQVIMSQLVSSPGNTIL